MLSGRSIPCHLDITASDDSTGTSESERPEPDLGGSRAAVCRSMRSIALQFPTTNSGVRSAPCSRPEPLEMATAPAVRRRRSKSAEVGFRDYANRFAEVVNFLRSECRLALLLSIT